MRRAAAVLITVAACLVPATEALGQSPLTPAPAPPPSTTTTPAPAPAPAPAKPAKARLRLDVQRSRTVLAGDRITVAGVLTPYAAGQRVTVRVYRGARKVGVRTLEVRRSGKSGRFTTKLSVGHRAGLVAVKASHRRTRRLSTAVAKRVRVRVLARRAAPGSSGPVVRLLQQRLRALGYVVGRDGAYDARTARAVLAFRKVTGMARTQTADGGVFAKLAAGGGRFGVRYPKHGKHVEADLSRQVIALIGAGGKVERIYPTSSGKPSTPTVLGSFRFYSKTPGTNSLGMVFSNYFIGGYAIHGYKEVPTSAASHGCLRVPVPDAVPIYNWISIGDRIDVYR